MAKKEWETYSNAVRKEDWSAPKNILQLISKQDKNNFQTFTKINDICQRTIALRLDPGNPEIIQRAEILMDEFEAARRAPRIPALISAKPQAAREDLTGVMKDLLTPLSERRERNIPELFRDLPEEMVTNFMNDLTVRKYRDKQHVIAEDDAGDSMFIIRSGKTRGLAHLLGRELELAILGEGDLFGEVGFLTGRP